MNVEIKTDLESLLVQINEQIEEVYAYAESVKTEPQKLRNVDGTWTMANLLVAKAQVATTLANLRGKPNIINITNPGFPRSR